VSGVLRSLFPFALAGLLVAANGARAADEDVALGSPKAPVTVIEYASVTCPHCAEWEAEVFPAFKRKYVDTGQVRYIMRELPTEPEDVAEAGFLVARCAGPQKFLDVVQTLMTAQKGLYADHDALAWLMKGAAVAGLNEAQMKACVSDPKGQKALADRIEANEKAFDVKGTPTFIINGKMTGDGEMTLAELDKAIQAAGTKAPAPAAKPKLKPRPKRKAG
jgi:protein-disulfide isomerase